MKPTYTSDSDDDIPEFDPEVSEKKEENEKQVKQKKVKQQHTYIGRQVKSGRIKGATTKTTGTIYKRTPATGAVSNAYFHIKWNNGDAEEKYKYGQVRNGKNVLKSLLGDI